MTLTNAIRELRRPFTAEAVRWKIQVGPKGPSGKAMVVAYIDARLAAERLNHALPAQWSDEYELVPGGLLCRITVTGGQDLSVSRCDVGWSKGTNTDIDLKALYSDAFKRAAVKFGVGVSIYALPRVYVPASELDSGKYLGRAVEAKLRGNYAKWLKSTGEKAFGAALGHGDAPDAQGDIETEGAEGEPESLLPANPKPLKGARK